MRHAVQSQGSGPNFWTERLRQQAACRAQASDHAEAARLYQAAFDVDDEDVELAMRLAYHWLEAGQRARAARVYLQAARILGRRGLVRRATVLVRRALEVDPPGLTAAALRPTVMAVGRALVSLLVEAAEVHQHQGRPAQARAILRLACDVDPMAVPCVTRLVELELAAGECETAVARLDTLGRALLRLGRMSEFMIVAEKLLSSRPGDTFFLRALGHAYLRTGRARQALRKLAALLKLEPRDAHLLLTVAEIYAGLGEHRAGAGALARYVWLRLSQGAKYQGEVEAALDRARHWLPADGAWQSSIAEIVLSMWTADRPRMISEPDFDLIVLPAGPPPPPPSSRNVAVA